ncbi:ATP-binding protein [Kosmotoga pacifica]|uniref:ATPase n=1 Tax=Kosmotoga pacifica TaxID=1330330 RepID=A0A0G2Z518_9BACT|nr:ATP-binding protein [Kosmotoga pacifica]AKI96647.1 ATPase [Kosmotoga pacifica]
MKFFDRIQESEFLKSFEKRNKKQMIIMYGRRRIGKTTLLRRVFPDATYFFVDTRSSETLLADFSKQIFAGRFENWENFFRFLLKNNSVIIMDEFQNFLKVDPSVFSILQKVWDETESKVLFILCGSYAGMMKKIFLDAKEPLFGRSDYQIQLKPFSFLDTYKMLKEFGYTFEEAVIWYSILGGVPKYLWYLEESNRIDKKIYSLFFSDFGPLREEGKTLLIGEFGKEHPGYFAVLQAIGTNDRELGEIIDRTGMVRTKAMKYLNELTNHYSITEKVDNFLSGARRGARYRIKDNFLGFWFRFVYSNQNMVEFNPEAALAFVLSNLQTRVGLVFEEVVKSLLPLFHKEGIIPAVPLKVGKHWGKIPGTKNESYEIDLIADCGKELLIFECKWQNKPVTRKAVTDFLKKSEYIKDNRKKIPVIISKAGFKNNIGNEVIKIDLDQIKKIADKHLE